MKRTTSDRGDVIHFAGFSHLSPALRDGAPAFASGPDASLKRCGWAEFFEALETRGLAVSFDPDEPSSVVFVPRRQAKTGHGAASAPSALEHSARFLRAFFGESHDS